MNRSTLGPPSKRSMPTTISRLTCWITVDDQVELASGLFQMRDTSASSARRSVADSASCAYMRAWLLLLPRSFKSALSLSATQFPVITPRCSYQTVACTGPHYRFLATLQQPGRHLQNALQNALSTEVHPALFPRSRTQFLCCPGRHFCKHLSRWGGRLRAALRSDRCRRRHRLSLFRYRRAPRTMCFYHRMLRHVSQFHQCDALLLSLLHSLPGGTQTYSYLVCRARHSVTGS